MMPRIVLLAACVLLAIQALCYFQHRWVEDESWYSVPAATLLTTGELRNPAMPATDYESRTDTRPALMPLSLAASFRVLGTHVWSARCGEFLAALLTLLVTFAIGRELGSEAAGALAALLLAADNFFVLASRTARPEAWVALLGSCGLLLVLRSRRTGSWKCAFAAGLAVAGASLFHVLGLGWLVAVLLVFVVLEGRSVLRSPSLYAYLAGAALGLLPFLMWLVVSPERMAAASFTYGRSPGVDLARILAKEKLRWSDFLGFSNQRLHLPFPLPLRLHIALAVAAALAVLWRRQRTVCWTLLIVSVVLLGWFIRLPNPSARYFAVAAPVFALALALATHALRGSARRAGAAVCVLCLVSQAAGSLLFLNQARTADYVQLTGRLRAAIPSGHSCYSAMTFAFALWDYGCHSYDRTPFSYTATVQRPEYMILGDRVMMRGSGVGGDDFAEARDGAEWFVKRHGILVSAIDDPFYGNLRIYRVSYDALHP